mgnify:CR=1 FL=1
MRIIVDQKDGGEWNVSLCLPFENKNNIIYHNFVYDDYYYINRLASFSNKESAELAIKELNSKELDGRPVHIRLDRNFTNDDEASDNIIPVFVGNLPWSVTNEDLAGYFVDFSPVNCNLLTNMYGKSRGFAIVNFNNIVDAERAISVVNGIDISGRVIEVTFKFLCSATNILYVFYHFIEYIHKNCI